MSKSKLLVALAVAATFATSAFAQSNVTIYGTVDASVQGASATGQDATKSHARIQSNESLIGFKGSEDLGNGTKALFQIETGVNLTGNNTGTNSINNGTTFGSARDSYVGLSTAHGTVVAGYLSTPYKSAVYGLDVFNPGDSAADSLFAHTKLTGVDVTPVIRSTAAAYVLPANAYGLTGSVAVIANSNNQNSAQQNGGGEGYSASLGWSTQGLSLVGAAQQAKFVSSTLTYDKVTSYLVGAQYTGVPQLKLSTAFNRNYVDYTAGNKVHQDSYLVGASYRVGKFEPRASYIRALAAEGTSGTGADQWNLGVAYHLSKRTQAYALYSRINNGTSAAYDFNNAPVATTVALASDSTVQTYGVGLRHSF